MDVSAKQRELVKLYDLFFFTRCVLGHSSRAMLPNLLSVRARVHSSSHFVQLSAECRLGGRSAAGS